jgi:hypothetical protein
MVTGAMVPIFGGGKSKIFVKILRNLYVTDAILGLDNAANTSASGCHRSRSYHPLAADWRSAGAAA